MNRTLLPLAALTLILSACAVPPPAAVPMPPAATPQLDLMGPGPVLAISAPQYCPGAPLRMIYYPFTDAERVKLAAHADCLKRHPRLQVDLQGPGPVLDAVRRELATAGVGERQLRVTPAPTAGGVNVVYPATLPE